MKLEEILKIKLVEFVNDEILPKLREQMRQGKHDINASSSLMQSLQINSGSLSAFGDLSVQIEGDFYWKFLEYGVDGIEQNNNAPYKYTVAYPSRKFHEAILEWIPHTGHRKPPEFKTYESYAWAIMMSIYKRGKKARPFVQGAINNIDFDKIEEELFKIIEEWQ